MATQLWLLRHGEAEPHDAREDFDRRLTPRVDTLVSRTGRDLAIGARRARG